MGVFVGLNARMTQAARRPRGRPASAHAGYQQVAAKLRARLIAGEWRPGTPIPPLRALALEYQVSLDVLRAAMQVMRQEDRVGLSGYRRLTAVPSMATKAPMEPARGLLIVLTAPLRLTPEPTDHQRLLLGMFQGAGELELPVMLTHGYTLRSTPPSGFMQLPPRGLLLSGPIEPAGYALYEKLPFPVVLVDRPAGRRRMHAVAVDNESAVRDAIARLAAQGHRKIALLRRISLAERDVDPDSQERQAAFKKALLEHGLPCSSTQVFSLFASDTEDSRAPRAVAHPSSGFTAALCSDPGAGQFLAAAARRLGRQVPRDLSIVCFQGQAAGLKLSGPAIDFFEVGRRAALLASQPRLPLQCIRVPAVWCERGSTGLAP